MLSTIITILVVSMLIYYFYHQYGSKKDTYVACGHKSPAICGWNRASLYEKRPIVVDDLIPLRPSA
jgi:hypothetical protein